MSIWKKQISDRHMFDALYFWVLFLLFLVLAEVAHGQVQSTIADNGATNLSFVTPYGSFQGSILLVGKFSNPAQPVDDILVFETSTNPMCMQNNAGSFSAVPNNLNSINSQVIFPFPFTRPVNFGTSSNPATDSIVTGGFGGSGNQTSYVAFFNTSGCSLSLANVTNAGAQAITNISNILGPTQLQNSIQTLFAISYPSPPQGGGAPSPNFVATNNAFGTQLAPYTAAMGWENAPPSVATLVPIYFPSSSIEDTPSYPGVSLSGTEMLGFVYTPAGVVAVTATQSGVDWDIFFDKITAPNSNISSTPPPVVTNISQFSVGRAVGWPTEDYIQMISGNFLGNSYDIAIAWGPNILLFPYAPNGPTSPFWNTGATLNAGGPITALAHGPIVTATEDDIVAQVGSNAIVWGSASVGMTETQLAAPTFSPPSGSYTGQQTITLSGPAGASIYYNLTNGIVTPPDANSTPYTGPFSINASTPISAISIETGFQNSVPVTATYTITQNGPFSFADQIVGPGTITGSASGTFPAGTTISVTAVPNTGATFSGWSGACGGTQPLCTFTLQADETVTATFTSPQSFPLTVAVVGPGTVGQVPSGSPLPSGSSVTLTAVPNANSNFVSWSGACNGSTLSCQVSITGPVNVTATFASNTPPPPPPPSISVTPSSQSTTAGSGVVTYIVTATGFNGTPTLTASAQIPKGQCVIQGIALDCTTTGPTTMSVVPPNSYRGPTLILLLISAAFIFLPRRRRLSFALCALALAGCGGGGGTTSTPSPQVIAGTPAGTYMISVTATSGTQTAPASATLIVQ